MWRGENRKGKGGESGGGPFGCPNARRLGEARAHSGIVPGIDYLGPWSVTDPRPALAHHQKPISELALDRLRPDGFAAPGEPVELYEVLQQSAALIIHCGADSAAGGDNFAGNRPGFVRSKERGKVANFRSVNHPADGVAPG